MSLHSRRVAASVSALFIAAGLVLAATPASAHENDISSTFTVSPANFDSGKVNTTDVTLTFTLGTAPLEYMIIELPAGYRFNAGPATLEEYNPATGGCGGIDTKVTTLAVINAGGCQLDPAHPNRFKILADGGNPFPTTQMSVTLLAGAFTAGTVSTTVASYIEVRTYVSEVLDEHGRFAISTVAPALPDTGAHNEATLLFALLTLVIGLAGIAFVGLRRR